MQNEAKAKTAEYEAQDEKQNLAQSTGLSAQQADGHVARLAARQEEVSKQKEKSKSWFSRSSKSESTSKSKSESKSQSSGYTGWQFASDLADAERQSYHNQWMMNSMTGNHDAGIYSPTATLVGGAVDVMGHVGGAISDLFS